MARCAGFSELRDLCNRRGDKHGVLILRQLPNLSLVTWTFELKPLLSLVPVIHGRFWLRLEEEEVRVSVVWIQFAISSLLVFFLTACDCRYTLRTVQPTRSANSWGDRPSSFHTTILSRISWLIWGAIRGRWVLLRSYQSELRTHAVKKKHQQTRNCELNLVMQTTVFSRHPSFTLLPCRKAQNF